MDLSSLIPDIIEHGNLCYPNESCGLAIIFKGKLRYYPCNNQFTGDMFYISPQEYEAAEQVGEVVGVCHTHINISPEASTADLAGCETTQLPWIIVSLPSNTYTQIQPTGYKAPLIGRVFYHGVFDCYSLIKDYYRDELNIHLNDYPREEEWWAKGYNLYEDNFAKEDFVVAQDLKPHDVLLFQNNSTTVNHGGIYVGNNLLLHHCFNRLSSRDVFGGYWRKHNTHILRHRTLL